MFTLKRHSQCGLVYVLAILCVGSSHETNFYMLHVTLTNSVRISSLNDSILTVSIFRLEIGQLYFHTYLFG